MVLQSTVMWALQTQMVIHIFIWHLNKIKYGKKTF